MASSYISIPRQFVNGIKLLSLINEDEMSVVYNLLHQVPKGVNKKQFLSIFDNSEALSNAKEIGASIFSFGGLLKGNDPAEEIANGLIRSLEVQEKEAISNEQIETLRERLKGILILLDNIKLIFQVYDQLSAEKSVVNIDLNPSTQLLFDPTSNTQFGYIFFKLKIVHREKDKERSLTNFFALDFNDLKDLRMRIDEAIENQEKIKSLNTDKINFIDTD